MLPTEEPVMNRSTQHGWNKCVSQIGALLVIWEVIFYSQVAQSSETFGAGSGTADLQIAGVLDYSIASSYQLAGQSTILRVLAPSAGVNSNTRFLYVLPVQAGLPTTPNYNPAYGDAMAVAQQLRLNDVYNVVVVAPSFNQTGPDPWYADNPTNGAIRQESYIVNHIVPFVDGLYAQAQGQRLLLGYSKSGWGALNLIFQHPDTFAAAAVWDAPLMMDAIPSPYPGANAVFQTNQNFQDNYRLDTHLTAYASAFLSSNRLWIGINPSGQAFDPQTRSFEQLLTADGIEHTLSVSDQLLPHSWSGGWVPDAMAFLDAASAPLAVPEPSAITAAVLGFMLLAIGVRGKSVYIRRGKLIAIPARIRNSTAMPHAFRSTRRAFSLCGRVVGIRGIA
jgi:hypothetical protein